MTLNLKASRGTQPSFGSSNVQEMNGMSISVPGEGQNGLGSEVDGQRYRSSASVFDFCVCLTTVMVIASLKNANGSTYPVSKFSR